MEIKKRPAVFYKYRPFDKYINSLFKERKLHFSLPSQFNDPFDSKLHFIVTGSDDEIKRVIGEKFTGTDEKKIELFRQVKEKKVSLETVFDVSFKDLQDSNAVFCLSENPNNILMWSHYANGHKGVCLGFHNSLFAGSNSIKLEDGQFGTFSEVYKYGHVPTIKVLYQDQLPKPYNMVTMNMLDLDAFTRTKSVQWSYEQEHRLVIPKSLFNNETHTAIYDRSSLAEVYLGVNSCENDIAATIKLIKENFFAFGEKPLVYKAKLSGTIYGIKLKKLKLNKKYC